MREWIRGFRLPNPFIPLIALGLCFATLAGGEYLLRQGLWARFPSAYLLGSSRDQYLYYSQRLALLKRAAPIESGFFVFGGSATRESSDASSWEIGSAANAESFLTTQQTFGETLLVLDNLRAKKARVLIGINPSRFTRAPQDYLAQLSGDRFLARSEALEQWADTHLPGAPETFLIQAFAKYAKQWVRDRGADLRQGRFTPLIFETHLYDRVETLSVDAKNRFFERHLEGKIQKAFATQYSLNESALLACLRLAKSRGWEVSLVEMPLSPLARERLAPLLQDYQNKVRSLAEREKVAYWDDAWTIAHQESDFYDLFHLVDTGRKKFERLVLARLEAQSS